MSLQNNDSGEKGANCLTRVLVIDNDKKTRELILELLQQEGYGAQASSGDDQELSKNAVELARIVRPHVAIVDLRIAGPPGLDRFRIEDDSGLILLEKLSQANCILRSAYLTTDVTRRALKGMGAYDVFEAQWSGEQLLAVVDKAAQDKCACRRGFNIHWPDGWDSKRVVYTLVGKEASSDLAADLLSQIFPKDNILHLETIDGSIRTPGPISRGHSVVFKAWPEGKHQPLLIKMAPASKILEEAQNYDQYVRRNMGGQFHSILEDNPITFWDIGGVLYSFIGTTQQEFVPFSKHYRNQKDCDKIVSPLRHFFEQVWKDLYNNKKYIDESLFEIYDKTFNLKARLLKFPNQGQNLSFRSLNFTLRNPVKWVLEHYKKASNFPRAQVAITHGDLHGDNIFVDVDHSWAIDFGRTGPGHILRDFIELEVDIITRLLIIPEDGIAQFVDFVLLLVGHKTPGAFLTNEMSYKMPPEIVKALKTINELRELAHKITHYNNAQEYYWGLLIDSLYVATMDSGDSYGQEKVLLLAAIICARLKNWGKDGPVDTWLTT